MAVENGVTSHTKLSPTQPMGGANNVGHASRGLTVFTAAMFAAGEMAGTGILALPLAINNVGWIGLVVLVMSTMVCIYTGSLLCRCWTIVQARYAECRENTSHPYPSMGQVIYGRACRLVISFLVNFCLFGCTVVYLLLASSNIQSLISNLHVHVSFCNWLIIVAAFLSPFSWLGTPKDFWPIAVAATVTTGTASLILVVIIAIEAQELPPAFHGPIKWKSFLMGLGAIFYGLGGHPGFPTFQADMKEPAKFGISCFLAFTMLLMIYLPVAVEGFLVYGSNLQANVLESIRPGPFLSIVQILITLHLLCATIIVLNPVCQEMEEHVGVPPYFCFRRIAFRTAMVALALFTALSVPQFGAILSLVGGSSVAALAFIFPPLFYLKLSSMKGPWESFEVTLHEKVACVEIIIVGALAGTAATLSSLEALTYSEFKKPCYIS